MPDAGVSRVCLLRKRRKATQEAFSESGKARNASLCLKMLRPLRDIAISRLHLAIHICNTANTE